MNKPIRTAVYASILALGLAASASAVTINQGLAPGLNTIEDQDREAFVDVDGSGTISIGDVFVGFVRLDDFNPASGGGQSANNQVYGVFSNQITGILGGDPTRIVLGTTTVAGLTLQDITGDANAAGGMYAIYDSAVPYGNNLITQSSPGATSMEDNVDYVVSGGDLRLVVGLGDAGDTYMHVSSTIAGVGASTAVLATLPTSATAGSFLGGLDVLYNNTNFTYNDSVITVDFGGGLHTTQVGIGNGAFRGAVGDPFDDVFTNLGYGGGFRQCTTAAGANVRCGLVTDADFFVDVALVPEPNSVALLGGALLAAFAFRRKSKNA